MNSTRTVGWKAVAPALLVPFIGSLVYFVWMPGGSVGQTAYTLTKLFLVGYPLLFLVKVGWAGLWKRREIDAPLVHWKTIGWTGVVSGVLIVAAGAGLMATPLGEIIREGAAAVTKRAKEMGFRENFVLFAICLSFIHSLLEEVYWRWFVYGNLRHLCGRWWAHGIAGIGFAAHHLVITLQFFPAPMAVFLSLCVAVGGVIWTLMYERQGTILGCWISHACVDVLLMVIGYQLLASVG